MLPPMVLSSVSWMLLSCLMLLSQVQGEDAQKGLPSTHISFPKGSKAYTSHCYALFLTPKSWMEANVACQKRPSGHLVSVLSGAKGSFVTSLVKSNMNNYAYIWIGFHDPTKGQKPNGGGWEWSSTDILNYLAWERDPSTIDRPGYCGSLSGNSLTSSVSPGFLQWQYYRCDQQLPYVCKFKY